MKVCSKCNTSQELTYFSKSKSGGKGYSAWCKICTSKYHAQYRQKKKTALKKYQEKWYSENKEYQKNKSKEWNRNNPKKAAKAKKTWKENNRKKSVAIKAKYRARKLNATPPWANLKAIEDFYKNCPKGYHVDHIVPLQGKNVCGLHVLENLQYLPAEENLRKGNSYDCK